MIYTKISWRSTRISWDIVDLDLPLVVLIASTHDSVDMIRHYASEVITHTPLPVRPAYHRTIEYEFKCGMFTHDAPIFDSRMHSLAVRRISYQLLGLSNAPMRY